MSKEKEVLDYIKRTKFGEPIPKEILSEIENEINPPSSGSGLTKLGQWIDEKLKKRKEDENYALMYSSSHFDLLEGLKRIIMKR